MSTLCILASTGSAVATCGVFGFLLFGRMLMETSKPERGLVVPFVAATLFAVLVLGMGSYAAEDRICEVAGLQP